MAVFSVPVTIGVDEERIAKEVESNVETKVVENVIREVKSVMFQKRNYYSDRLDDPTPLRNMVKDEIRKILVDHEDDIVKFAGEALAEKLARTKAVKEKAALIAEAVLEEETE